MKYPENERILIVRPCLKTICLGVRPAAKLLSALLYQARNCPDEEPDFAIQWTQEQVIKAVCEEFTSKTLHDTAIPCLELLGYLDVDTSSYVYQYTMHLTTIRHALEVYGTPELEKVLIVCIRSQLEKVLNELEKLPIELEEVLIQLEKLLIVIRKTSNSKRGRKARAQATLEDVPENPRLLEIDKSTKIEKERVVAVTPTEPALSTHLGTEVYPNGGTSQITTQDSTDYYTEEESESERTDTFASERSFDASLSDFSPIASSRSQSENDNYSHHIATFATHPEPVPGTFSPDSARLQENEEEHDALVAMDTPDHDPARSERDLPGQTVCRVLDGARPEVKGDADHASLPPGSALRNSTLPLVASGDSHHPEHDRQLASPSIRPVLEAGQKEITEGDTHAQSLPTLQPASRPDSLGPDAPFRHSQVGSTGPLGVPDVSLVADAAKGGTGRARDLAGHPGDEEDVATCPDCGRIIATEDCPWCMTTPVPVQNTPSLSLGLVPEASVGRAAPLVTPRLPVPNHDQGTDTTTASMSSSTFVDPTRTVVPDGTLPSASLSPRERASFPLGEEASHEQDRGVTPRDATVCADTGTPLVPIKEALPGVTPLPRTIRATVVPKRPKAPQVAEGPPAMPPEDAPWCAETIVEICEARRGRRYPNGAKRKSDRERDVQLEYAAQLVAMPDIDREKLVRAATHQETRHDNWWMDTNGYMTPRQLVEKDRIHNMLDELRRQEQKAKLSVIPGSAPPSQYTARSLDKEYNQQKLEQMRAEFARQQQAR